MRIDATGNIFGLFTWDHDEPYILCGSHLDSQENGGVYDGAYGELTKPEDLANGMRVLERVARTAVANGGFPTEGK